MNDAEAAALKRGRRVEAAATEAAADAQLDQDYYAFLITDGILGGEDLFVDDLLVFDGPDNDKDTTGDDDAPKADRNHHHYHLRRVKFEPPSLTPPTHDAAEFEWMSSIIGERSRT